MMLSIVSTLYQSELHIREFYSRSSEAARRLVGDDYEIVFVNDGSPDASLDLAIEIAASDRHLTVVDLSRNFGHHKAMMTGLSIARGEKIFLIDSDLEEEPEWLLSFNEQMRREQCDVVFGVQYKRKGGIFERLSGKWFYRIFRLLTGVAQPDNIVTARLMTRRYVNALVAHRERELNIGGLWIATGFDQSMQMVHKHDSSKTTYTLGRKIGHLVNAITSFSSTPLVIAFYVGFFISFSALFFITFLFFRFFFISAPPDGYVSIIASIWLFSGLIIFFIGLQGIYLSKMFLEVKQRPFSIIKSIYSDGSKKEVNNES